MPVERLAPHRVPPPLGGALLGGAIYAAFSPLGAPTRTGAERAMDQRPVRETVVHGLAALSVALTNAFAYHWLRERW